MTDIRTLAPGDEAALESFLQPHIDSSMFLLGNMRSAGLRDRGERYQGTYAASFDDDRIVGVVAHYWNLNLIFQTPLHLLPDLVPAVVKSSQRAIKGLIGPAEQVAAAWQILNVSDTQVQMDETEKLYSLPLADLVIPAALQDGTLHGRRVEPRDLDILTAWRVGFSIEALGEQEGPALEKRCRTAMDQTIQDGYGWLVELAGRPVACSMFNAATAEAVQVGGVWTPPEWRRQGYARAAVATSLLDARANGATRAILFTGQGNIAAQKAYTALNFRHIGQYRIVLLKESLTAPIHS